MANHDPLWTWRDWQQFSVDVAASLIEGVPPTRTYPGKADLFTQEMRAERDGVTATRNRLIADGKSGALSVRWVEKRSGGEGRQDAWGDVHFSPVKRWVSNSESTVTRADLIDWLESHGLRPAFFFSHAADASEKPLTENERGTLLQLVGVLCELAGIDLQKETKGHAEAKRLRAALDRRGVRTKNESIAKKIVEARDVIAPKGPESLAAADSNSNRPRSKSNK